MSFRAATTVLSESDFPYNNSNGGAIKKKPILGFLALAQMCATALADCVRFCGANVSVGVGCHGLTRGLPPFVYLATEGQSNHIPNVHVPRQIRVGIPEYLRGLLALRKYRARQWTCLR